MRKTLSVLAIIAALSSTALAGTSNVSLSGGTLDCELYYGDGNVTISAGSATELSYVFGKYNNTNASVNGAEVKMTGGELLEAGIVGGGAYGSHGDALGNTVTVSGGTVDGIIRGGYSKNGGAYQNAVDISGDASLYSLIGGETVNGGDANANTVTISGGEVETDIRGGRVNGAGNASANGVIVRGGTIRGDVAGAYCENTASAYRNTVTISGGKVGDNVYGGCSEEGNANNNTVTISGGEVEYYIYGGESHEGNANGNTVIVSGGTIGKDVEGGYTYSTSGSASSNTVIISGGLIKGDVAGSSTYTSATNATVSNNTVTISGGTIMGNVIGGNGQNGETSDNTVNLVGAGATLGELTGSSFTISKGVAGAIGGICNGNTLNVYGKGITAGGVAYFNVYNFHLAPGTQNGDTMLTLTGDIHTDLRDKTVNVKCSGATQLKGGDNVNLIHHSGTGTVYVNETTTTNVDIIKGVSATYAGTVAVSKDKKDLVLTLESGSSPTTNDEALKSMTETRTDVAALVNAAADFMATTGVQQAKLAAKVAALTGKDGVAPFVALGGSSMRYNTGSHVDADGFNGALGVAKAFDDITLGVAGEYGLSSYKSYVGSTNAKGDSKLYGGALLADWQDKQGWHAEGAVRLGRTSTDYSAMTALGGTHYTDHASYQGALIGGGKEFKVSRKSDDTVDLYARYIYTHTNASNTTATSGEEMHFAGVDSHRTMVGARYNHELTDTAVVYAGAAWMHEFDGDAHSVIGGFTAPSPSLEGDSGMVEIGTTFAPMDSQNVLINLNVQGWTGVQRGISGGAGCTIKF